MISRPVSWNEFSAEILHVFHQGFDYSEVFRTEIHLVFRWPSLAFPDKTEKAKFTVAADNGELSVAFSDYNEVIKLSDSKTINDENDVLLLTKIK